VKRKLPSCFCTPLTPLAAIVKAVDVRKDCVKNGKARESEENEVEKRRAKR
jgi:hypothetical protein